MGEVGGPCLLREVAMTDAHYAREELENCKAEKARCEGFQAYEPPTVERGEECIQTNIFNIFICL